MQKRKNYINMEKLWSQGIEKHCTLRTSFLCVFRKWKEKKGKRELIEATKGKKEKEERKEGRKRECGRRKQRKNSLQSFSWHLISSVSPHCTFQVIELQTQSLNRLVYLLYILYFTLYFICVSVPFYMTLFYSKAFLFNTNWNSMCTYLQVYSTLTWSLELILEHASGVQLFLILLYLVPVEWMSWPKEV